jgi:ubiquinone biosynthesis protein
MNEELGWRAFLRHMRDEAPQWVKTLPQLPRLLHRALDDDATGRLELSLERLERAQLRQTRMLAAIAIVLAVLVVGLLLR